MKKTWIVVLTMLSLQGCRKEHPTNSIVTPNGIPVTVTLNLAQHGAVIPATFQGLSFETELLGENPAFLNVNNSVFIQLLKNLGPGLFRIGGDTSDETTWTGNARTANTPDNSITTTDIDRLAAFSKLTGWQVLFGLNLGNNDAASAADEAQYAYKSFGNSLFALQSGNEPDVYHLFGLRDKKYDFINFQGDWENYFGAINSTLPQVSFAGPGTAYNTDWITYFADSENNHVKLLDAHYYVAGPASDPSINYKIILNQDYKLGNCLNVISSASQKYKLPFRITECNNIYGGGKTGISDTFASALWTLNLMWTIAQKGGQGINLHGGTNLVYSPVIMKNSMVTARPEYYAMLAFKYGSNNGTIIPASISNPAFNCSVYACVNADNSESVTLINRDELKNFSFTVEVGRKITNVQVMRLSAPSITATDGTTLGGSTVGADGSFNPSSIENYTLSQDSFLVNVPTGSAAIITVK